MKRTIVISGYYGFGNSGDEAVLLSILLALRDEGSKLGVDIEPVVLSANPEETSRIYGVRAVHRMKLGQIIAALRGSDGLISGGGSLLQDATGLGSIPYYLGIVKLAQWLGKPTFVYSQGVGPVNRSMFYPWIRRALARSAYVSVRDEESAKLLERMGLERSRVHVVPDPVMGLPRGGSRGADRQSGERSAPVASTGLPFNDMPGQPHAGRRPVIGVSVRFWNADRSELDGMAVALREIREHRDAIIRFLPFHLPSDLEASRYVAERIGSSSQDRAVQIVDDAVHPQDMLAEVGACGLLIGMRLHSLIYAASQRVPMIGVSYDPKIDHFLHRLQMKAAASTRHFSPEAVVAEALRLLDGQEEWRHDKQAAIDALKSEAHEPARQIALFFQRLSHEYAGARGEN